MSTLIPPPRPSSKLEASGGGGGAGVIKEESTENLIDFQPKPIKNDFTEFLGDLYKQTPPPPTTVVTGEFK